MGSSLGGFDALRMVLGDLPESYPVPVAVVQHRSPDFSESLRSTLAISCRQPVLEVEDKQPIDPGFVWLAPQDYHLLVDGDRFALSIDEPVNSARPSVDVLFRTAAATFGSGTVAVVLTGTGRDGTDGATAVHKAGGLVIVQSLETASAQEMPSAALRAVPEAKVVPLNRITSFLAMVGSLQDRRGAL